MFVRVYDVFYIEILFNNLTLHNLKKKTLFPLHFMDGVQLPKARATSKRQFTFYQ